MRVKLQLVMCNDKGDEETVTDVITLNKNHQRIEHLGLTLAESKQLLSTLQRHLLQQQVNTFLDTLRRARTAGRLCSSKPAPAARFAPCLARFSSTVRGWSIATANGARPIIPPPVGAADRVGCPGAAVYGSQVVLSGLLWA